MNIVVIGGTGHIGRFLIRQLADDGHRHTRLLKCFFSGGVDKWEKHAILTFES